MYARLTQEGTAAADTAVCALHVAQSPSVPDAAGALMPVEGNSELECVTCGAGDKTDLEPVPGVYLNLTTSLQREGPAMKYVLLADDGGAILVACPDDAAAESLGAAAILADGGVSARLVPARAVGWDHERVTQILNAGGSVADVEAANLEMSPRQLDSDLTEDEAITESIRLRDRFNWSGTMFVQRDVIANVRAAWRAHDEDVDDDWTVGAATWHAHEEDERDDEDGGGRPQSLTAEREKELVGAVMGYAYRKLADRFAEIGNEALYEAAESAIAHRRGDV